MSNKRDLKQAGSNFIQSEAGNLEAENEKREEKKKLSKTTTMNTLFTMKINKAHKEKLQVYFKENKGLTLSSGIRQIIYDFMHDNNII